MVNCFDTRYPVGVITGILGAPYLIIFINSFESKGWIVMKPTHVLSVENLFAGYDKKTVLQDVTVTIPSNKISIIIGGNGCGKSTLLKTMARLIKPTLAKYCWMENRFIKFPLNN